MKRGRPLFAAVALLLTSCGGADTYSADEARTAFEDQGFVLFEPKDPRPGSAIDPWASGKPNILMSRDARFVVFVGRATDAEQVWARYESGPRSGSFDARRANVIVISDAGLDASERRKVQAALASLPDKGSPVVTLGPT